MNEGKRGLVVVLAENGKGFRSPDDEKAFKADFAIEHNVLSEWFDMFTAQDSREVADRLLKHESCGVTSGGAGRLYFWLFPMEGHMEVCEPRHEFVHLFTEQAETGVLAYELYQRLSEQLCPMKNIYIFADGYEDDVPEVYSIDDMGYRVSMSDKIPVCTVDIVFAETADDLRTRFSSLGWTAEKWEQEFAERPQGVNVLFLNNGRYIDYNYSGREMVKQHFTHLSQYVPLSEFYERFDELMESKRIERSTIQIKDLLLSARSDSCLNRAGLYTLADIAKNSRNWLKENVKHLGLKGAEEVSQKMAMCGMRLSGEDASDKNYAAAAVTLLRERCEELCEGEMTICNTDAFRLMDMNCRTKNVHSILGRVSEDDRQETADACDEQTLIALGERYCYKESPTAEEYEKGVSYFEKAAEIGSAEAMVFLGDCYETGEGKPRDYVRAVEYYRGAAEKGNAHGMYNLGKAYELGHGVTADYAESLKWYELGASADICSNRCRIRLAEIYYCGEFGSVDYEKAAYWLRRLQEFLGAQILLGECYLYGRGVERNCEEAARIFREVGNKYNPRAFADLGLRYERGDGVKQDCAEAIRWFKRAANAENRDESGKRQASGAYELGRCLCDGIGVKQDKQVGFVQLFRAAMRGHAAAQVRVGEVFATDRKDMGTAILWYGLAAKGGSAEAKAKLAALANGLSA